MTALLATTLATPAGPLSLVAAGDALVAAGFVADPQPLLDRLPGSHQVRHVGDLGGLSKALAAYFDGDLGVLDDIPVRQPGTAYQQQVWAALRRIPPGQPTSYAELACSTGRPSAARAAGHACGRNLVAPVVPCHRVVRVGGALGGYAYGLPVKRWLLDHERRHGPAVPGELPFGRPRI